MATIKIPQSSAQIRVGAATQTGALTLPITQLTQTVGAGGWGAIGKVVEDLHREQVAAEDNAQFQEIAKKAIVDIEQISFTASKNNTDIKLAINTFETLTQPERWNDLLEGKRKKVKSKFNQWLNKTKLSEYAEITKAVTDNHILFVKQSNNDYLNSLALKASSTNIVKADNAMNELIAWLNDPVNSIPYDIDEWNELKEDMIKKAQDFQFDFGAKNNPDFTIENSKEIEKVVGAEKAAELIETAKLKIASNIYKEVQAEKNEIVNNQDTKMATFTELTLRLLNMNNPALVLDGKVKTNTVGEIPSLDAINDFWKANQINTAQYQALLKFYANPQELGRDDIYQLINDQFYLADGVEQHDAIQRKLKLSPDYLLSLGIKDITRISSIIDKAKDRQVFQDMKYYKNVLDDILGKLEEGGFVILSPEAEDPKEEKKLRTQVNRLYNEYLDDDLNPDEAFLKVVKGYLLQKDRLPVIYDVAAISSIQITEPSKDDKTYKSSVQIFEDWRLQVLEQYKKGNISLNEMMRDFDGLDVMEDVFNIRKTAEPHLKKDGFDAWQSNNTTTSQDGKGEDLG